MTTPIVAIDARLVGGTSTGDSTYWTGLLYGISNLRTGCQFLLCSNAPKPAGIPESDEIKWIQLHAPNNRWWSMFTFPLAARRLGAQIVHTQYNLSPLARNGVTTIHDVSFFVGPQWFKPRDRALLSRFVPTSVRRAARVITVSETSKQEIERYIPAAARKTRVTYNACPPWIRQVPREEAKRQAAALGLEGSFMLTVGTRWPRKNMQLATSAVELLPTELPHKLAITGKPGWGEENLGPRAYATGYVTNEQLSALYSAADLYLAPSLHEGFGIPLTEAFTCGCPVICSTGGALPEVAGDAAIVEQSWEPGDWSNAIQAALRDSSKLDELRLRGIRRAAEFSWEDTARKTVDVYREILA